MRGLDEINSTNENPHQRRDEHFGARAHEADATAYRSFETNMADKRRREQAPSIAEVESLLRDLGLQPGSRTLAQRTEEQNRRKALHALDELFFTALLADILASGKPKKLDVQDRIHSAIDAEPPFFKFWQKLNERLAEHGQPEAGYKVAREAFSGGPTPVGALTFIGKQWDGLRAVPAEPVKFLGGIRPAYHGEYRIVSNEGTVWHKVVNDSELPIVYKLPEAALTAAEHVRNKNFAKEHH
jgi:hypothetical protein